LSEDLEHLTHIYVRRPKRDEYFRTCPDPAMSLVTLVWVDDLENETYLVLPDARAVMADSGKVVNLTLCQSRQRVNFLWPLSVDVKQGGGRGWGESARAAALLARRKWIKIRGDRAAGAYSVYEAADQGGDPEWPSLDLSALLKLGFQDRLIDKPDHPAVRRLQGYL
jgi:hypothetical protein